MTAKRWIARDADAHAGVELRPSHRRLWAAAANEALGDGHDEATSIKAANLAVAACLRGETVIVGARVFAADFVSVNDTDVGLLTRAYVGTKIIKGTPAEKGGQPGYRVEYPDGYVSWSPKATFELAYRLVSDAEAEIVRNGR